MNEQYNYRAGFGQLPAVTGGHQVAVYNPYTLPDRSSEDLDLRRAWHVIRRYRWLILSIIAVAVVTILTVTLMMRPVYRATAVIELKPNPTVIGLDASGNNRRDAQSFRNTQRNILRSEAVTQRVIEKMELAKDPELKGELRQFGLGEAVRTVKWAVKRLIGAVNDDWLPSSVAKDDESGDAAGEDPVTSRAREERALLKRYMDKLVIRQVQGSDLLQVSFDSFSADTAAAVANAHTREYIRFIDERRFSSTSSAKKYLQEQIEEAEAAVESSEKALTDFAREHNIVDVEDRSNVMQKRFEDLSEALTKTRQERIIAGVEYKQAQQQTDDVESLPAVLGNSMISSLRAQYADLRAEYQEMAEVFKDSYPKMQQLKSKMEDIRATLREESQKLILGLEKRYEQLEEEEQQLAQQLETQRTKLLDLKERAISYNILKREWEANRELYTGLLGRQKDFSVASGLEFNDASILDHAVVPTSSHEPDIAKNVVMAGVFGLAGGVAIAFLLAFLENTFTTREELEQALGMPLMGIVPNIGPKKEEGSLVPTSLISAYQPANAIAESIRSIRTGVLFSRPEHVPKKILITSTLSGEGKSTIALNLSLILAQGGSSVVIVDADLRRPVVGKWLNISSSVGLADYLNGQDVDIVYPTSFENLSAVPAGGECTNPTDLLASLRMRDYLNTLSERFDFVILDGPPCLGVADSMLLSVKVDGTLLIVKAKSTERHVVAETVNRLRMVNAPLIGSILNCVDLEQPEYGYYGTYYGYGGEAKQDGTLQRRDETV